MIDLTKNTLSSADFKISISQRAILALSLILIGLAIILLNIESDLQLPNVILVILVGFFIHSFLPLRFRVPFFLILNFITLVILVKLAAAIAIVIIGLFIVAISTYTKLKLNYRIVIIAIIMVLLAIMRIGWLSFQESSTISRIVGVLFMFRILVYLYDLKHEKESVPYLTRVSYFFLIPNLFFPIFPVVDYTTFKRSYFSKPEFTIYKKGILWMARGVFHLLLYRFIYFYLLPSPTDIKDLSELLYYMVTAYLLTLRLSGLFHFSAGVLCLFGYDLPKTFDKHFLASGFSDLWRRINVYWRDFLMKVFYYPLYFKFKKLGVATAMIITLVIVFVINMLLHSYQWFWIRGDFVVSETDLIFWGIFGLFVTLDALLQINRKPKRNNKNFSAANALLLSTRVVLMFLMMSLMWSLWISPNINEWLEMVSVVHNTAIIEWISLIIAVLSTICMGTLFQYYINKFPTNKINNWSNSLMVVNVGMLSLVLFAIPNFNNIINKAVSIDTTSFLTSQLNQFDEEQLFAGYYDNLLSTSNINSKVWELEIEKPKDWQTLNTKGMIITHKKEHYTELKPNQSINHKGAVIKTNSHGLRDNEYSKIKEDSIYRIALLGTSIDMGVGVENQETYENLIETSVNNSNKIPEIDSLEILNFSISSMSLPGYVGALKNKVINFKPDMLWVLEHQMSTKKVLSKILEKQETKDLWQIDNFIDSLILSIPSESLNSKAEIKMILDRHQFEVIEFYYKEIADLCKINNIIPVMIYVQALNKDENSDQREEIFKIVKRLGFQTLDLSTVFEVTPNRKSLQLGKWDTQHPNKIGHEIIANSILNKLNTINFKK
jgi:hypothetical protein